MAGKNKHWIEIVSGLAIAGSFIVAACAAVHQITHNQKNFELSEKRFDLDLKRFEALMNEQN